MRKNDKISVFNYLNYREYLKDLYSFFKKTEGLSLRQFARKADFSSHAYLKNIIDGYREATVNSALKLAKGFNLSDKEASYLELLIRFNRATNIEEKNVFYKKLSKIKPKNELSKIEKEYFSLFSNWYVIAIREMINVSNFKEDYEWIAKTLQPNITAKQAKDSIELLLKINFLERDENNKLIQSEANITTGPEVDSLFVKNYHKNLLELSIKSLELTNEKWRDISSMSFTVNREEFSFIKKRIVEFRKEIAEYLQDRKKGFPEDEVITDENLYHLNLQLFNGTIINWKELKK